MGRGATNRAKRLDRGGESQGSLSTRVAQARVSRLSHVSHLLSLSRVCADISRFTLPRVRHVFIRAQMEDIQQNDSAANRDYPARAQD